MGSYNVAHSKSGVVFGISPGHDHTKNYNQMYADTAKWLRQKGYVDYLCPQLYFGFEHSSAPFDKMVDQWMSRPRASGVNLYVGLAKMCIRDRFADRSIRPMLIGADGEAFDDPDYIYELKLDGERCIAYLDPKTGTDLINKRQLKMRSKVPERSELHRYVKKRCILDGELFCLVDGKPDFSTIQRRSLMSNRIRIDLAARQYQASFVAFDILVLGSEPVMDGPLMERKRVLQGTVKFEEEMCIRDRI